MRIYVDISDIHFFLFCYTCLNNENKIDVIYSFYMPNE